MHRTAIEKLYNKRCETEWKHRWSRKRCEAMKCRIDLYRKDMPPDEAKVCAGHLMKECDLKNWGRPDSVCNRILECGAVTDPSQMSSRARLLCAGVGGPRVHPGFDHWP